MKCSSGECDHRESLPIDKVLFGYEEGPGEKKPRMPPIASGVKVGCDRYSKECGIVDHRDAIENDLMELVVSGAVR